MGKCPQTDATIRGVSSLSLRAFTLAPAAISVSQMSTFPASTNNRITATRPCYESCTWSCIYPSHHSQIINNEEISDKLWLSQINMEEKVMGDKMSRHLGDASEVM